MNRLDEPIFMEVPKPLTEFGIHYRLESYDGALNGRLSNYLGKQATTVLAETTILADFRGLTGFSAIYVVTFISGHQYLANHQMAVGNRRMTADLVAPPVDAIYQSPSIDEYQAPDRPAPPPPQEINYQPPPATSVDEYSAPVQYTAPAGQETYQPPPPVQEPYQLPPGKPYPGKAGIIFHKFCPADWWP